MKHFIVIGLLAWLYGSTCVSGQRFHAGIKGGLVASEISGDNLAGPNKLGAYGSVYTFTEISDYSLLQLEIMYIQKGSRSVPLERNDFNEYMLSLQYVEVPVVWISNIARYTDLRYLERLWFHAGLSFSTLVGHYEQDEYGADVSDSERGDDFNSAELNLILGFSYPLISNLDFVFGFSNSLTPARPHVSGATRWYNRGQYHTLWTFGLSYILW